ncbi:hypothetical protein A3224_11320 [Microbulbifer thermotolerans]|uniref:Transposase n=1 Tax=Microbulbifer thermotolerans TaxID=252514 RepID=A0A143HNK6_MICTH|nr:hypothetical protein [Microbulbifer thermotolerans]AMX03077.1 hypothetical protein A3224_11320 [Microbulbifer thermotolerans]
MPRQARILLANMPHRIVQRAHNQKPVFLVDEDYQYCRDKLYIELNPVRAGMVRRPRSYKWPSYRA